MPPLRATNSRLIIYGYHLQLCFLLLSFSSLCQVKFEKTLDSPLDQYGNDVIQSSDSCYMVIGGQYDHYYQWPITDYMMFKVNPAGNLLWTKSYQSAWGETRGNALVETIDQGIISCGRYQDSDACMILCQPDGDTIWTRQYEFGEGYGQALGICQTSDESFAFTGGMAAYSDEAAIIICSTDPAGQLSWVKQFRNSGNDEVFGTDILQAADGCLVVCGYEGYTSVLIKLSMEGDSLWMIRYEGLISSLNSIKQTVDGGYICCGLAADCAGTSWDYLLLKTDPDGNMEWNKVFGDDLRMETAYDVQIAADRGYVICGQSFSPEDYNRDAVLIRTNQDGDTLWTRTFGSPDLNEEAYGIDATFDGGYVITGYKMVNDTLSNVYLIKTDADGHTTWIWEGPVQKALPLQILPNPNHGVFKVGTEEISSKGELKVRDLKGSIIYKSYINGNAFQDQINLQPCSPGLYFATLKTESSLYTAKFLVIASF